MFLNLSRWRNCVVWPVVASAAFPWESWSQCGSSFHVLICYLHILSGKMSLYVFCPCSDGIFLMLSFDSSLHVLNILFIGLVICKSYLHFVVCILILLTVFPRAKVWNFDGSNISNFQLSCFLVFYLRSCLLVWGLQDFLLYITRKVL